MVITERLGQPLTQELLNSIMRNPGETRRNAAPVLPVCPRCGERYCGDGVQMCTECAASNTEVSGAGTASAGLPGCASNGTTEKEQ